MAGGGTIVTLLATDSHNQVPIEAKALSDQIFAIIERLSEIKESDEAGWLLLRVLPEARKENDELRALSSQFK